MDINRRSLGLAPNGFGAFPDKMIKEMADRGLITGHRPENIGPASLDLTLSEEAYRVEAPILPQKGENVRSILAKLGAVPHSTDQIMERGVNYIVRLNESVELYPDTYGYCNPKSTTGRHAIIVKVVADDCSMYDHVPSGHRGELWMFITPRYYPVIATVGESLAQLRLFNRNTRLSQGELANCFDHFQLLWQREDKSRVAIKYRDWLDQGKVHHDGSIFMTPFLAPPGKVSGYVCSGSTRPLRLVDRAVDPSPFYAPLYASADGYIKLEKDKFYILSTNEAVKVPQGLACEVRDIDSRFGYFCGHLAGFVDPGFGYGHDGKGQGSQITLEVIPYEDLCRRSGDIITSVKFERMIQLPERHYDEISSSNYRKQWGPGLAKQFAK